MSNETQKTGLDWFISELQKSKDFQRVINEVNQSGTAIRDVIAEAKKIDNERMDLPINVHKGVTNIHVYIKNGVINVKKMQGGKK